MGIQLHYIDSISPYLDEILSPIIKKHFSFKLNDTFRILTPDSETARDLEEHLLEDKSLGQVLIGRSVMSWSRFFDLALQDHLERKPLASFELEAKTLHLIIKKQGFKFGHRTLYQTLQELKRHNYLAQQFNPRGINKPVHPWAKAYQDWVRDNFLSWTPEQAWEEIYRVVSKGNCRFFFGVSELFFMGFPYPTAGLLKLLNSLKLGFPKIQIHLFLPAPESFHGPDPFFNQVWQYLEELSEERIYHKRLSMPEMDFQLLPTPLHEAQLIWNSLQANDEDIGFLLSAKSTTQKYLYSWANLGNLQNNNPSLVALRILEATLNLGIKDPLTFQQFFNKIFPLLLNQRKLLAEQRQNLDLKYLEDFYRLLLAQAQLETYHEELLNIEEWVILLRAKIEEPVTPTLGNNPFKSQLREWKKPGLKRVGKLLISSLNERPPGRSHGILDLPSTYKFDLFEERILLQRALFHCKERVTLTWVGHDMSGRILPPASALSNFTENLDLAETHLNQFWGNQAHPYFNDNYNRETHRLNQTLDKDSGNLETNELSRAIRHKTHSRTLSPSYIDDYAHCPWRFMARWHFRVDTTPEADLEIDPRLKGNWAHLLLEKLYQKWLKDYFQKGESPPFVEIATQLNETAKELTPNLISNIDFPLNPTVLADEWEKIQKNVGALAEADFTEWRESKSTLRPVALEWKFGLPPKPHVNITLADGTTVALGGTIDRVDYDPVQKCFLVIDYKSSQSDILSKALRDELSFQLFLYLQAVSQALFPNATGVGALYWDLKKLKRNQGMVCKDNFISARPIRANSKTFLKSEEYSELYHRLLIRLKEILSKILKGHYHLAPPDCQGPRCPYHEVCRYREQPDA